jgi:hypothetical protein
MQPQRPNFKHIAVRGVRFYAASKARYENLFRKNNVMDTAAKMANSLCYFESLICTILDNIDQTTCSIMACLPQYIALPVELLPSGNATPQSQEDTILKNLNERWAYFCYIEVAAIKAASTNDFIATIKSIIQGIDHLLLCTLICRTMPERHSLIAHEPSMSVQAHFAMVHVPELIDLTGNEVIDLTDEVTEADYGNVPDTVVSNLDVSMNNLNLTTFDFSPSEICWLEEDQWQARHAQEMASLRRAESFGPLPSLPSFAESQIWNDSKSFVMMCAGFDNDGEDFFEDWLDNVLSRKHHGKLKPWEEHMRFAFFVSEEGRASIG